MPLLRVLRVAPLPCQLRACSPFCFGLSCRSVVLLFLRLQRGGFGDGLQLLEPLHPFVEPVVLRCQCRTLIALLSELALEIAVGHCPFPLRLFSAALALQFVGHEAPQFYLDSVQLCRPTLQLLIYRQNIYRQKIPTQERFASVLVLAFLSVHFELR
eukprot:SAG11_NODE_7237_length_1172_cov_1.439070_2_plen_157_part_00